MTDPDLALVKAVLKASADLGDAVEQLLGTIPAHANPVVIARPHLKLVEDALATARAAGLAQIEVEPDAVDTEPELPAVPAASDSIASSIADDVALIRGGGEPRTRPVDPEPESVQRRERAAGALDRAGYEEGGLERAFRQNPGGLA